MTPDPVRGDECFDRNGKGGYVRGAANSRAPKLKPGGRSPGGAAGRRSPVHGGRCGLLALEGFAGADQPAGRIGGGNFGDRCHGGLAV